MKVYIPNIKPESTIGGGWTFLRNFKANAQIFIVDNWQECDIFFITGITMVDEGEVIAAAKAGKKIVLRVDNVPKKSRNRRRTPHERLKEFANLADVVIYQSNWAREYVSPLCGDGPVIYNGVDKKIFFQYPEGARDPSKYLFVYHGKNDMKGFWTAHQMFQNIWRKNKFAKFLFINDFGSELPILQASNFDFWNGENYEHIPRIDDPKEMADLMNECGTLIYPAISDACPNTVLEALACGMKVIGAAPAELAATEELLREGLDISVERMVDEYLGIFKLLYAGEGRV